MCQHPRIYSHTCTHAHILARTQTYTHTHTHTHTHTYTYTHTYLHSCTSAYSCGRVLTRTRACKTKMHSQILRTYTYRYTHTLTRAHEIVSTHRIYRPTQLQSCTCLIVAYMYYGQRCYCYISCNRAVKRYNVFLLYHLCYVIQ